MTVPKYTADELVAAVRRGGGFSNSAQLGTTDAEIIQVLNEQMWSRLVPGVIKNHEQYFKLSRKYTIDAVTKRLRVPPRAIGQQVADVFCLDGTTSKPTSRIDPSMRYTSAARSEDFYYEGNDLVFVAATGTVELSFACRPGGLVKLAEAGVVQSVDFTTDPAAPTVTLASVPAAFTGLSKYDVHSPYSGAEVKQLELMATNLVGNVLTFAVALDGTVYGTKPVEVGDYVSLTGEAALPGLPQELHIPLHLATVISFLSTLDPELAGVKQRELDTILSLAGYIIDARMEGRPARITGSNPINR